MILVFRFLCGVNVTVVIVIRLNLRRWVLVSCLSIWLGNSILQLIDSLFLKLLSQLIFLFEPCIFCLALFINIDTHHIWLIEWSLRMTGVLIHLAITRTTTTRIVWCCHIKHNIIKVFEVVFIASTIVVFGTISISIRICILSEFWVFRVNINELIVLERHIFFDEIINTLAKANLVIQTWRFDQSCRGTIHLWKLDWILLHLPWYSLLKFFNLNLFDISVACILKNNELMCNNSICYLLLFFWVQLESFWYFMYLLLTATLHLIIWIQNWSDVELLFTAWVLIVGPHRPVKRHLNPWRLGMNVAIS